MTTKKTKTHSDKITYRAVQIQGGKIIGRSVQLFNLNSIHFGSLSIGTCAALGNGKGGDSGKKEKDDEGGKQAVFAESHPEPVLKSKCFLMKHALIKHEKVKQGENHLPLQKMSNGDIDDDADVDQEVEGSLIRS